MSYNEKIIVALDFPSKSEVDKFLSHFDGELKFVKVGMELFYSCGPEIIKYLKDKGLKVFLDLKLHDIPNTVESSIRSLSRLGVDIINVHASGGLPMLKAARAGLKDSNYPTKLIGVTILTSMDEENLSQVGLPTDVPKNVTNLATLTKEAGLDGVVCSPVEISLIKKNIDTSFITVTPGIRPTWASKGDQKRVTTPREAFNCNGDYIVIGRPITRAENPKEAFNKILEEIQ